MHCNTISLMAKEVKIEELLEQVPDLFDVIGVSETKLSGMENIVNIHGFQFLQHDSSTRHFGGVGIYIKNRINFLERHDLQLHLEDCENLWIEISAAKLKKVVIGIIYMHPSPKYDTFMDKLGYRIEKLRKQNATYAILGDINIDQRKITTDTNIAQYFNFLNCVECITLI